MRSTAPRRAHRLATPDGCSLSTDALWALHGAANGAPPIARRHPPPRPCAWTAEFRGAGLWARRGHGKLPWRGGAGLRQAQPERFGGIRSWPPRTHPPVCPPTTRRPVHPPTRSPSDPFAQRPVCPWTRLPVDPFGRRPVRPELCRRAGCARVSRGAGRTVMGRSGLTRASTGSAPTEARSGPGKRAHRPGKRVRSGGIFARSVEAEDAGVRSEAPHSRRRAVPQARRWRASTRLVWQAGERDAVPESACRRPLPVSAPSLAPAVRRPTVLWPTQPLGKPSAGSKYRVATQPGPATSTGKAAPPE